MKPFSFPPPPPPPPKASVNGQEWQSCPQDQGRGRGRGRGRGFPSNSGLNSSRGRGSYSGRGNPTFNSSKSPYRTDPNRSKPHNPENPKPSTDGSLNTNESYPPRQSLPPGAYVNPRFDFSPRNQTTGDEFCSSLKANQDPRSYGSGNQSLSRTYAGHKRKLEALRGPAREKKPAPPTAPSVPVFGASLPLPSDRSSQMGFQKQPAGDRARPKSTGRSLGLTLGTESGRYSSSEDDDDPIEDKILDEESMYAELGNKLKFEYNGTILSLDSQADLVAWKKDRQKNWPTKARLVEKDEQRRRIGAERKRLLAGAIVLQQSEPLKRPSSGTPMIENSPPRSNVDNTTSRNVTAAPQAMSEKQKAQLALENAQLKIQALRKKVEESEARNRQTRAKFVTSDENTPQQQTGSEGILNVGNGIHKGDLSVDGVKENEAQADDADDTSSDSHMTTSSSEVSYGSSAEDSDDGPPEVVTSKSSQGRRPENMRVCRYFALSGSCREGNACRFLHERPSKVHDRAPSTYRPQVAPAKKDRFEPPVEESEVKKSLFERLVKQEDDGDAKLALEVIKYLGGAGFFKGATE